MTDVTGADAQAAVPVSEAMADLIDGAEGWYRKLWAAANSTWTVAEAAENAPDLEDVPSEWVDELEGFEWLGTHRELAWLMPIAGVLAHDWVDEQGMVRVSIHRSLLSSSWNYTIWTYFDDGGCLTTWSKPDPSTPTTTKAASLGSTGSLGGDLERHYEKIEEDRQRGHRPIAVRTEADIAACIDHYYRQIVPRKLVVAILLQFAAIFGGILYVVFIL
ncbi:MAG: hypothetical protein ABEL76_01410 [Bradymonadaceae bacterium]